MSNQEIAFALSMRTLDMTKDYASWFSKQVGLQQYGKYELKKDFIKLEKGKQVYVVPAGREINKVMWVAPPTTDQSLFANYGGIDIGFAGGFGQLGGGAYGPVGGFYTAPAADVAYLATDLQYKNRLLRSDLVYKVTAGPNGTHLIQGIIVGSIFSVIGVCVFTFLGMIAWIGIPIAFGFFGGIIIGMLIPKKDDKED